jgi:hypothetical protein
MTARRIRCAADSACTAPATRVEDLFLGGWTTLCPQHDAAQHDRLCNLYHCDACGGWFTFGKREVDDRTLCVQCAA